MVESVTGYEEIAAAIAEACRGPAGTSNERQASAALVAASIHCELAALLRALHREELIDASLFENGADVTLRQNGVAVNIQRLSNQHHLRIELSGFDASLVPPDQRVTKGDVAAKSFDECAAVARTFVQAVGHLIRREHSLRGRGR